MRKPSILPSYAGLVLKSLLGLCVIVAVGRQAFQTWTDLQKHGVIFRIHPGWLSLAGGLYLIGLLVDGVWFYRVLSSTNTPVPLLAAIRAYIVSHLGKYIPGKALVVVMRVAMVIPEGVQAATAAIATLYETLVMMAAGSLMALMGFVGLPESKLVVPGFGAFPLVVVGAVLALGFLFITWPSVFLNLSKLLRLPFPAMGPNVSPLVNTALFFEGLLWTSLGWLFLGLSQVAILYGIGYGRLDITSLLAVVGSVALATVAGFVVPVSPGGLGIREWALWTSLATLIDPPWAVVASLGLRLVWVTTEILAAAVLLPFSSRINSIRIQQKNLFSNLSPEGVSRSDDQRGGSNSE